MGLISLISGLMEDIQYEQATMESITDISDATPMTVLIFAFLQPLSLGGITQYSTQATTTPMPLNLTEQEQAVLGG